MSSLKNELGLKKKGVRKVLKFATLINDKVVRFNENNNDDDNNNKEGYCDIDIPINNKIFNKATQQITQFKTILKDLFKLKSHKTFRKYILNSKRKKNLTINELIAYRLYTIIDWSTINYSQIKEQLQPLLNAKLIDLENNISKEYGYLVKLNDIEIKISIHEWILWRSKLNDFLIDSINQNNNNNSLKNDAIEVPNISSNSDSHLQNDVFNELVNYYILNKWSNDCTKMKFNNYVHYGIPRPKKTDIAEKTIFNDDLISLPLQPSQLTSSSSSPSSVSLNYGNSDNLKSNINKLRLFDSRNIILSASSSISSSPAPLSASSLPTSTSYDVSSTFNYNQKFRFK